MIAPGGPGVVRWRSTRIILSRVLAGPGARRDRARTLPARPEALRQADRRALGGGPLPDPALYPDRDRRQRPGIAGGPGRAGPALVSAADPGGGGDRPGGRLDAGLYRPGPALDRLLPGARRPAVRGDRPGGRRRSARPSAGACRASAGGPGRWAPGTSPRPGLLPGLEPPTSGSLWSGLDPAYRLPVLIAYLRRSSRVVSIWPLQKNLGELIALSAAVLMASQFWYIEKGGTMVLLYQPLFLLMMFRPNLVSKRAPRPDDAASEARRPPAPGLIDRDRRRTGSALLVCCRAGFGPIAEPTRQTSRSQGAPDGVDLRPDRATDRPLAAQPGPDRDELVKGCEAGPEVQRRQRLHQAVCGRAGGRVSSRARTWPSARRSASRTAGT